MQRNRLYEIEHDSTNCTSESELLYMRAYCVDDTTSSVVAQESQHKGDLGAYSDSSIEPPARSMSMYAMF